MSLLAWFWIAYIVVGIVVMMKPLVLAWSMHDEFNSWIKIGAAIVCVLIWPVIFFLD